MINTTVKKAGGGGTRSTQISLQGIENEVASLAGRAIQTPISIESLWNEVQNLKVTTKSWEIVTINQTNNKYLIPEKYRIGWNWILYNVPTHVLDWKIPQMRKGNVTLTNGKTLAHWVEPKGSEYRGYTLTYFVEGNYIVPNIVSREGAARSIQILFYK